MTSTNTTRVRSGAASDATGASGGLWGPGAPREGAPSPCVSPAAAGRPVSDVADVAAHGRRLVAVGKVGPWARREDDKGEPAGSGGAL